MRNSHCVIFFMLTMASGTILSAEDIPQALKELDTLRGIDLNDEEAVQNAVAESYLQCAALFNTLAVAYSDTSPDLSETQDETRNWHIAVGMTQMRENGNPINSKLAFANAYMENYMAEHIYSFSEADFRAKLESCSSADMLNYGNSVILGLGNQTE